MKYKLILFNILFYIITYHIVFELLEVYVYNLNLYTPLSYIYRKYILHQELSNLNITSDLYMHVFNLLTSSILFYFAYRLYGKDKIIFTFLKLTGTFIIINFILGIYVIIKYDLSTSFVYIYYFLIPMSIMTLLILPIFWVSKKITNFST